MSFRREQHYVLEMCMINMSIDSEQTFEYNLNDIDKVLGERNSKLARENLFVIQLIFYPSHQKVDIFCGTDLKRSFDVVAISP